MRQDVGSWVIFDGECGICRSLVAWVCQRGGASLRFLPYQELSGEFAGGRVTPERASRSVFFLQENGRVFSGARAIFEILAHLSGGWGKVGRLLALPPLALFLEPGYRLVARYRGRISRWLGLEVCSLPLAGKGTAP